MRRGDPVEAELRALLERFGARIRLLIERSGLAEHGLDAADLEQEVRIRLWRALADDRIGHAPASYVQRVVLTVVVDALRRVRPAQELPAAEAEEALVERRDPEAAAGARERLERLERALVRLPLRRRQPVRLHLLGYGFAEIGRLVGVSPEGARKLVERGLAELRRELRETGGTGDD
ncbi:MAG: sigma-70 family RNA polymerase sigma factor [Xanthomonadales bacterium]|nr:sigma-70 family RNA polymerase sigma factor [Xanthomonadales bacterium]